VSFSRFGADDSDVYTFPNSDGLLECCGCSLTPVAASSGGGRFVTSRVETFLTHLETHSMAGDVVPGHTGIQVRAWVADHPDGWGRR
jgi:hypothetical protein